MEIISALDQLSQAAKEFWKIAGNAIVIAFHGNIGVGKTSFIHTLCIGRGVKDTVTSPTFSLINEYFFTEDGVQKKIFHIDLYRIKDENEAMQAGIEDCLYSDHICLIEWPEKISSLWPDNTLHVFIEVLDSVTRRITIADK
jgi:tRNA threonylcarbamoyladenosine biosynthesis protein TsaE